MIPKVIEISSSSKYLKKKEKSSDPSKKVIVVGGQISKKDNEKVTNEQPRVSQVKKKVNYVKLTYQEPLSDSENDKSDQKGVHDSRGVRHLLS